MSARLTFDLSVRRIEIEADNLKEILDLKDDIKDSITSYISAMYVAGLSGGVNVLTGFEQQSMSADENVMSIADAIIKLDGLTEVEWLLVIAYFLTEQGNTTFDKANLIEEYKKYRNKESNIKNFKRNYDAFIKKHGSVLSSTTCKLTRQGAEAARALLNTK